MNVCVFCSASDVAEIYTRPAERFAGLLGAAGHTLVWGGNNKGMMQVIAESAKSAGAKLVGVNTARFAHLSFEGADEMFTLKTLAERKAMMLERSDIVVVMVGGIGTLDEATDVLELKKHGAHAKPIVILNTDNFYGGLKQQLKRMSNEGFLQSVESMPTLEDLIYFADTPETAMEYINVHGN